MGVDGVKERLKGMIGRFVHIEYVDQGGSTCVAEGLLVEVNDTMLVLRLGRVTRILTNIVLQEVWDLGGV